MHNNSSGKEAKDMIDLRNIKNEKKSIIALQIYIETHYVDTKWALKCIGKLVTLCTVKQVI